MSGIDLDNVRSALGVPDRFRVEAAIAIGRIGNRSLLAESLRSREQPSDRKPIADFAFEGRFRTAE